MNIITDPFCLPPQSTIEPTQASVRPRWYRLYFLLALLDIVTVAISMGLNVQLMNRYSVSVELNQAWSARQEKYAELATLATEANAPGNDVFDGLDTAVARRLVRDSLEQFNTSLVTARNDIVKLASAESAPLLATFASIDVAMKEMHGEAIDIFRFFEAGETAKAGNRMATMDRKFSILSTIIAHLSTQVRTIQHKTFNEQLRSAQEMRRVEFVILLLVSLMVVGALYYGRRIVVELKKAEIEQEKARVALNSASQALATQFLALQNSESEQQRISAMLRQSVRDMTAIQFALDQHAIVSITDLLGNITYANDLFFKISGYSHQELLGKNHRMINSGNHPPEFFADLWQTITQGKVWHSEICNRHRSGSLYWVNASIVPLLGEDGRPEQYIAIRTDISARKEAESEMLRAKDAAEQANQVKSAFLANMSHEIRTPMNGIIGMTELALDTELNAEQREYLGLVKVSADALLNIVNDILDFSKIEAGRLEIENIEFSLEQMLRDTMKSLAVRAHQKDLELLLHVAPDVPDCLISDPGRLRQVLVNLVGNAIKFTQTGEIEVAVTRIKAITPTQTELRFSVRDTGIGIAREKFKAIFDSFSQADTSTTRQYGGTGLGLSISAHLVSLMGGHLELESELGQGSTFYFTLSLTTGSNDAYARYQNTERVVGLPVLIVDDNTTNRSLLVEMLRNWQMLPTAVESGEQALQELERASASATPYVLAILDVQMPVMDGFELAQRILAQPKYVGATVMMLTSEGQRGQATRCRELGIASYVMKPIVQSELLDAIMTALGEPLQSSTPRITRHSLRENRRRLNLLLAEDNAVNQTLAVRLLQKLGHTVTVAHNGLEAVEHWQAGGFDAILMDVDMPIMNGYEATERIRAIEKTSNGLDPAHTPIVAMTAHVMRGVREICISHGMDAYLAKPIDTEALRRTLDGLMLISVAEPEVAPATPVLSSAKVADFAAARQTMDDDRELFEEIVKLFQSDAPGQMQKIREALARGESEVVCTGVRTPSREWWASSALNAPCRRRPGWSSWQRWGTRCLPRRVRPPPSWRRP